MRRLPLACAVLTLLVAASATAQPSFLGQPYPLTNTRYGGMTASATRLVSDGRDFYLFWESDANVRMTRVTAGERRAGKAVVSNVSGDGLDVLWTGTRFLVVAASDGGLIGQFVTTAGERAGAPFLVAEHGYAPRIAANYAWFVVLYSHRKANGGVYASTLHPNGRFRFGQEVVPAPSAAAARFTYEIASNGESFAAVVLGPDADRLVTFDREGMVRSRQIFGSGGATARIASDGLSYLVAVTTAGQNNVTRVEANGAMGQTVTLDESGNVTSLIHKPGGWTAAFVREDRTHVVHLDKSGQRLEASEAVEVETARGTVPQLAGAWQRTMLIWSTPRATGAVAELPLTSPAGSPVLFGATTQRLLASAAAQQSTLFVWSETADQRTTLFAGIRRGDGTWTEQVLAPPAADYPSALAASDGQSFAVLYAQSGSYVLQRLGGDGQSLGAPVAVKPEDTPAAMIWNGGRYVLVASGASLTATFEIPYIATSFLSADGVIRLGSLIYSRFDGTIELPRIAWNGTNYLAVWATRAGASYTIEAALLGDDLRQVAATTTVIASGATGPAEVAWDGTDFVIGYPKSDVHAARVSAEGTLRGETVIATKDAAGVHVATVTGGVAVTWRSGNAHHVATLRRPGGTVVANERVLELYGDTRASVVAIPGDRALFVGDGPSEAAPHHGARRLIAAVLDIVPPRPLTSAPAVTVTALSNSRLQIDWTALAEPVTGYRVEYRIGDGNWNEIERPPDPSSLAATFAASRPGLTYAFRVRGMNEAGMGPYSEPAELRVATTSKRRAVR